MILSAVFTSFQKEYYNFLQFNILEALALMLSREKTVAAYRRGYETTINKNSIRGLFKYFKLNL